METTVSRKKSQKPTIPINQKDLVLRASFRVKPDCCIFAEVVVYSGYPYGVLLIWPGSRFMNMAATNKMVSVRTPKNVNV